MSYSADNMSAEGFQPYAFLLHGRRGSHDSAESSQSSIVPETHAKENLVADTEHGKYLAEHLEYIVPPVISPVDQTLHGSGRTLFVGHLRFETTTADVRWMIKKLCNVNVLRVDVRGNGCCVAHFASDADVSLARSLSRRVLFDRHGFWFARTAESVDRLLDYVHNILPKTAGGGRRRALHLPRDAIVVEESRSNRYGRRALKLEAHCGTSSAPMRSKAGTPCKSPKTPLSLGKPTKDGTSYTSANFHQYPPDYVNPPPYGDDEYRMPTPFGCSPYDNMAPTVSL